MNNRLAIGVEVSRYLSYLAVGYRLSLEVCATCRRSDGLQSLLGLTALILSTLPVTVISKVNQ